MGYAARTSNLERYMSLYSCPRECLLQTQSSSILATPVTKTSKGTCLNFLAGPSVCVTDQQPGYTDCRPCAGIYNNVAPDTFSLEFTVGTPISPNDGLAKMIQRVQLAGDAEPMGNVLRVGGDPLAIDDTAICHTVSKFECPGEDAQFEADVEAGKCSERLSVKIDDMCNDGPCDSNPDSAVCRRAKDNCEVDPDSGVRCMPGNENDPCADCVSVSAGEVAACALSSLLVVASML